jgi:hypothetical protein
MYICIMLENMEHIPWQMCTSYMINSHHVEIGFIVFIVINFDEVGSHRELIFLSLYVLLAWGWPYTGRNM